MSDRHALRRERLLKTLRKSEAEALLVTDETNVRYLTGFTGDSTYLLIAKSLTLLISDGRYATQIAEECPDLEALIRSPKTKMTEAVATAVARCGCGLVGFEEGGLSFAQWERFRDATDTAEWVPTSNLVENLRMIKDAGEIAEIREAIRLAERAFQVVTSGLVPDMTELEITHDLQQALWRFGAPGVSFPPIVARGDRAALAHYRPSRNEIGHSRLLLIDWGAEGPGGYVSDMTRTFAIGKISAKLCRIHDTVNEARQAAIAAIRPGAAASDVDGVARGVIEKAGHGKHFGHGLGHGIGMQVHEAIRLSTISEDTLKAGMVVTVEPGIYLPGWGGVRIEDDVLVTRDGCEVLSNLPRELEAAALS